MTHLYCFPVFIQKDSNSTNHRDTRKSMFIVALFTTKSWNYKLGTQSQRTGHKTIVYTHNGIFSHKEERSYTI